MIPGTSADLKDVSSDELNRRARAHLDGMFSELSGATVAAEASLSPLELVKRHPALVGAAAAGLGLLAARLLRGGGGAAVVVGAAPPARTSVGRTLIDALVGAAIGAAGRSLPGLLLTFLSRRFE